MTRLRCTAAAFYYCPDCKSALYRCAAGETAATQVRPFIDIERHGVLNRSTAPPNLNVWQTFSSPFLSKMWLL